jgi:hypothetical protein
VAAGVGASLTIPAVAGVHVQEEHPGLFSAVTADFLVNCPYSDGITVEEAQVCHGNAAAKNMAALPNGRAGATRAIHMELRQPAGKLGQLLGQRHPETSLTK